MYVEVEKMVNVVVVVAVVLSYRKEIKELVVGVLCGVEGGK